MNIVKAYLFTNAFGEVLIKAITDDNLTMFIPKEGSDIRVWREFIAGGGIVEEDYVEPPEPEPVPEEISDRQFAQQLAIMGLITNDEALAWVRAGTVPAALMAFINALPVAQQFAANMLLSGATTFRRDHQFTADFGAANGMSPEQIDALWLAASKL